MSRPFLAFVAGLAIGLLVGGLAGRATSDAPAPAAGSAVDPTGSATTSALPHVVRSNPADQATSAEVRSLLTRLDERLAGLEGALTGGRAALPSPAEEDSTASSDAAPWDELAASVRALEDLLHERIEGATARHAAKLQTVRDAKPEADWVALQDLLDAWAISEAAAREHVLLLSDISVLERFGPPGLIFPVQTGDRWVYGQNYDSVKDAYALQVVFQIEEQVVTGLWVEGL